MKYLILPLLLLATPLASPASNFTNQFPSYDSIPITPETWQKVDLSYIDTIKGKQYPGEIKLLRPIKWLQAHHMEKKGNHLELSIPEFGINKIHVMVTSIKSTNLDTSNVDWSKTDLRPVIGTFKRYAPIVKSYTFKDAEGQITKINATPNHPFYVRNKGKFIAIEDIPPKDHLITQAGNQVKLLCSLRKNSHCGEQKNNYDKPLPVYNLEVYQKHVYYVGKSRILVHNNCFRNELMKNSAFKDDFSKGGGCFHVAGGCIAKYGYDRPVSDYITAHVQNRSYAMRFNRWLLDSSWDELPKPTVF